MFFDQDTLRARFCHAHSEMYKTEVPLYGDLVDLVYETDSTALNGQRYIAKTSLTISTSTQTQSSPPATVWKDMVQSA